VISSHPVLSDSELIVILAVVRLMRVARRYWIRYDGAIWSVIN
jgi:hypothetical protein